MSIEALAMAGADYVKCGFDLQELEKTPQHLLAEQRPINYQSGEDEREELLSEKWQVMMNEEMEARAKVVAAFNLFLLQISGLERITNLRPPRKC